MTDRVPERRERDSREPSAAEVQAQDAPGDPRLQSPSRPHSHRITRKERDQRYSERRRYLANE